MLSAIVTFLASIGLDASHVAAGLAGGVIRALVNKNGSKYERIAAGAVGTLCAAYLTPLVLLFVGATAPAQIGGAIGFMLGIVGMSLTEAIISLGKDYAANPGKLREDMRDFLLRLLGSKKDGE